MTGHVLTVHSVEEQKHCRDISHCVVCDGGLAICRVCGAGEGGLTTECPGYRVCFDASERVYKGQIDFRGGKWVPGRGSMPCWLEPGVQWES